MAFPAWLELFINVQRPVLTPWLFSSLPDLFPSTFFRPDFPNPSRRGQRDGPDGTAHMQFALWPGRLMNPFGS